MNQSNLNAATLNTAPLNVVQRVILAMTAVASIAVKARVLVRDLFAATGTAVASTVGRALARSPLTLSPSATSVLHGQERVRAPLSAQAVASIGLITTVFERDEITAPVSLRCSAVAQTRPRMLGKVVAVSFPRALATITGKLYYSRVHGVVTASATALCNINFETTKWIPFDENAPDERTVLVPEENRLVMVN